MACLLRSRLKLLRNLYPFVAQNFQTVAQIAVGSPPTIQCNIDIFEVNAELKHLVKSGRLCDANRLFDNLPTRDEVTWTTIISGYVASFEFSKALSLFSSMYVDHQVRLDPFVLSVVLKACGLSFNDRFGELLHGYTVKTGFVNSVFVGSSLLDMYMKIGKTLNGCKVFDEMPIRNVVSWTAIITGLVHAGHNHQGLSYFSDMWRGGEHCDSYTFAIALKACAVIGALNHGREIHTQAMKNGLDTSLHVTNSLSAMYNKCGKLNYGLCLFGKMETPDVVSWTNVIASYVQMGRDENAITEFLRMRESEVRPNEYTFAAVVSACASLARTKWGEQLHAHVLRLGLSGSLSVSNSIMTMYSKGGDLDSSSVLFNGMKVRDVVSWSTVIAGYAQSGCADETFEFLSRMRRNGPKPTEFALASVLSVCANMAILEQGKQIHAHVLSVGLDHTSMVQSGLINMYSKCGSLEESEKLFLEAEKNDDIVTWTSMINGYAEHGQSVRAVELFEKLLKLGLRPDSVTFIGVLTACSHGGLVELGLEYFDSIEKKYGISRSKEHYGCVIDLLCRAGRLGEAEGLIRSMPHKRDDVVWSSLLRGCRARGDVECGERAAEEVIKLDPNCAGTHITMANLYAAKGKWVEAGMARKMMKSKGLMKEPGWSWIKIMDSVSAFVAGDRSHPQAHDIYSVLGLIVSEDHDAKDDDDDDLVIHFL
ncbi:putative pentatricopeptide repeat-containing protein At3g47840 [Impatiens glandulifera]|uniref:putative pentatricopeptide repeat-containing protein At3g47840 n=1 Tax=Impatiens glandulifera TaxID=253017 RepID=UPI001FB09790|nr:putative pentatricopeptide repeat-containing protein At3g47840 [Impatiens glandulifera]